MSEYTSINVTSVKQLLQHGVIRLRSWKGDYLHRPDGPEGVTTWSVPHDWQVACSEDGRITLLSWKGDYLHRPDSPQGVTTWSNGDWTLEINGETVRLKSWKGDYLHRADGPNGVTTWPHGNGNEWHVEVPVVQPVTGDLFNTMAIDDFENCSFAPASTFTQRFQSGITSIPTELGVRMGDLQGDCYHARLVIEVNGAVRFRRNFINLSRGESDGATVFPLYSFPMAVRTGDWVSFSVTPSTPTRISALKSDDPRCPPGHLHNHGPISSGFYMHGKPAARIGNDPIRSTIESNQGRATVDGPFTQTFTAVGSGIPRELGVVFGLKEWGPFECTVTVSIRGVKAFERVYKLPPEQISWRPTVFQLDGLTTRVEYDDQVSFTITPSTPISLAVITRAELGMALVPFPEHGITAHAQFYMTA